MSESVIPSKACRAASQAPQRSTWCARRSKIGAGKVPRTNSESSLVLGQLCNAIGRPRFPDQVATAFYLTGKCYRMQGRTVSPRHAPLDLYGPLPQTGKMRLAKLPCASLLGAMNNPGLLPESSSATSRSLLERVQADDAAAWDRLVSLYAPLVFQWCRRW